MLRPPVVLPAHAVTPLGLVLADAEFDGERIHRHVREQLGAMSVILAERGKETWRVRDRRAETRAAFPRHLYRRRTRVERVFLAIKRKLSARVPGQSLEAQRVQALLLGLATTCTRSGLAGLEVRREPRPLGHPVEGYQQSQTASKSTMVERRGGIS
jgi:hypothetical protein